MYSRLRTLSNVFIGIGIFLLILALVGAAMVQDTMHYLVQSEDISAFSLFAIKALIICVPISFFAIAFVLRAVNRAIFDETIARLQMSDKKA